MQNMSEHVYYSEPQRILYRLLDSTHITQTIVGNTLVTEQSQHSSEFVSKRKTKISANGLIYNNLHGNQCNNFHIPNILDFLWNSNGRKRTFFWLWTLRTLRTLSAEVRKMAYDLPIVAAQHSALLPSLGGRGEPQPRLSPIKVDSQKKSVKVRGSPWPHKSP